MDYACRFAEAVPPPAGSLGALRQPRDDLSYELMRIGIKT
jgi:hypothetical protein